MNIFLCAFNAHFIRYSCVDEDISEAVMESMMRQMFYLVEETLPFALCDDGTLFETGIQTGDSLWKASQ